MYISHEHITLRKHTCAHATHTNVHTHRTHTNQTHTQNTHTHNTQACTITNTHAHTKRATLIQPPAQLAQDRAEVSRNLVSAFSPQIDKCTFLGAEVEGGEVSSSSESRGDSGEVGKCDPALR